MKKEDTEEKAREYVFKLLNYRERSRGEVEERLKKKKFDQKIIKKTIAYFERIDLLNDERFARLWVRSRMRFRPRSTRLIHLELRQKGLEKELIERIIKEEISPGQEMAAALALAIKQAAYYKYDPPIAARRKLFAYLARRGFPFDMIKSALEKVFLNEWPPDQEEFS